MMMLRFAQLLVLLGGSSITHATIVQGEANSKEGFVFLGRFCFGTYDVGWADARCGRGSDSIEKGGGNQVHITLDTHGQDFSGLQVYLYDDQFDGWRKVWGGAGDLKRRPIASCTERSRVWSGAGPHRTGHLPCDGVINVTARQFQFTRTIYQKLR